MPALPRLVQRFLLRSGDRSGPWLPGLTLALVVALALAPEGAGAEADPDDQVSMGVVIGADGRPAANVEVWLTTTGMSSASADVLDNVRSDGAGRFTVKIPGRWFQTPASFRQELGLVALSADGGLAALAFNRSSRVPGDGIQLDLPKPSETKIRVVSPDKRPVADARLAIDYAAGPQMMTDVPDDQMQSYPGATRTPNGLATGQVMIALPPSLQKRFSATTSNDGKAVIKGLSPDQIGAVGVTTAKFGVQLSMSMQSQPRPRGARWPAEIQISAVGTLRGKLVAKNPEWIKGRRLKISASDPVTMADDVTKTIGIAEVTTDETGRFEIAALVPGTLRFTVSVDAASRTCIEAPLDFTLEAGKTREIEIPVVPTVRVRGVVQEADGGKPIADLGLAVISGFADIAPARTDGQGAYQVDLPPGQAFVSPLLTASLMPAGENSIGGLIVSVPNGRAEFQAPPLKLRRVATIRGAVVDDAQKAVAGATVAASWYGYARRNGQFVSQDEIAATNERGEFEFSGVDFRSDVVLRAHTATACTAEPAKLKGPTTDPVSLPISPNHMARIKGRAVDSAKKPVADLRLELWARGRLAGPRPTRPYEMDIGTPGPARRVEFPNGQVLKTDARGEFVSPPIEAGLEYRIELRARGFRETTGQWVTPAAGETRALGLAVRRVAQDRGFVRDTKGRPVPAAAVTFSEPNRRVETTTDQTGAFHLNDISDGGALLFVRKEGMRFHGERYVVKGEGRTEIVLETPDEAPVSAFTIVRVPGKIEDRRARALKFLEQSLDAKGADEEEKDQDRMRTLEAWARIDPAGALARLEVRPFKDPMFGDLIRRAAVQRLAPRDADAALEIVETMSPGYGRAEALLEICNQLPPTQRQRQLDLLADALVTVRAVKEPEMRLAGIALIAEKLLDLGEQKRGEKLLRDELETARQLGTAAFAGYARGAFAEKLGLVDVPAALELIKGLQDADEFDRHHGNLAHELAGKMPEEAEQTLNLIKPPDPQQFAQRDSYAVRVCYRMANVDFPRTEKIAVSIGDLTQRAYALGVMADALAPKDAPQARQLLRRAYDVLEDADRRQEPRVGPYQSAVIAGALLATAARLDPDAERLPLLKECVWRTVSLVPPATNDPNRSWYAVEAGAAAALWLAEFDAPLAREVLSRVDSTKADSSRTYAPAVALVDADRIDTFLEGLPDHARNNARMSMAAILPLEGPELRRRIHRVTGVWPIDVEDIVW